MIKPYHLLIAFLLGALLCGLAFSYWPSPDQTGIEDPIIHRLKEEIDWRSFKEDKIKDSLKFERKEKIILAKENIELRAIANKAIDRYKEVRKAIPLTPEETIFTLQVDTAACDSALLRVKELNQGLTKEIINDNKEIETLDSLNINLESDKRDLQKIDTLHQEKEKKLEKKVKKNFWKGFSWGALFLGAAELAWKLALFLL